MLKNWKRLSKSYCFDVFYIVTTTTQRSTKMNAEISKKIKSNKIEIYKLKSQASLSGQFKRSDKLALKKRLQES